MQTPGPKCRVPRSHLRELLRGQIFRLFYFVLQAFVEPTLGAVAVNGMIEGGSKGSNSRCRLIQSNAKLTLKHTRSLKIHVPRLDCSKGLLKLLPHALCRQTGFLELEPVATRCHKK